MTRFTLTAVGEHVAPPEAERVKLRAAELSGTLFHETPRGARVPQLFSEPVTDADQCGSLRGEWRAPHERPGLRAPLRCYPRRRRARGLRA